MTPVEMRKPKHVNGIEWYSQGHMVNQHRGQLSTSVNPHYAFGIGTATRSCQRLTPGGSSLVDRYAYNMHTASVGIEYDPAKAAANLKKHGVSFAHAEQVLRDPLALTIEDPDARGEFRYVTLGMDALGRLLVVTHTSRAEWTRIISARKANATEAEQYHA